MRIEDIVKNISKTRRAVFSLNDIVKYGNISRQSARVYIARMKARGLLKQIGRNRYAISEDPFIVSSQLFENSYISFTTALYIYNVVDQVPSKIYVVSPKRTKIMQPWLKVVRFPPEKIFGFRKIPKENSFIVVGELEKVVVDIAYRPKYSRLSYALKSIEKCDVKKLIRYAERMSLATQKRIGYLLDLAGIETSIENIKGVHKLNPGIQARGRFNSKWRLYINEVLEYDQ